ncbi:MAG: hypothetical protein AAB619_04130 [Patescibacteria group bacterium]
MPANVLALVYPPEQIFITGYLFDDPSLGITVTCRVPTETFYTARPIPYVTAENYVRCLSQASYLLAEHVLEARLLSLEMDVEVFRSAAANYEIYYRNLAMTFHHRTERSQPFEMRLALENWREIRRMGDFLLFTFANKRTVISGEMSFVFPGH